MGRFINGASRDQTTLFPSLIDEYITEDNPVRVIDVFVDELDLDDLGFSGVNPAVTGRPSYHPSTMLKIYIYGYLNRIQSSRRLEREAQRNLELIWLTGKLAPDFKTIADFRRDNGPAIQKVCSHFIIICRDIGLFSNSAIAIDGSKFKAVNSRDQNYTERKLQARIEQTEERVARYLEDLDRSDKQADPLPQARVKHLQKRLIAAKKQLQRFDALKERLKDSPDGQISLTDPDARSMATSGKGTGIVGYNVQTAVDAKHHLILAHEVTNQGHDRSQLAAMAQKAKIATGQDQPTVFADRGYYSGPEILKCEENGITAMVPKIDTSNSRAAGRFGKRDFSYIAKDDEYLCPAGERAQHRFTSQETGQAIKLYWSSACQSCSMQSACTTTKYRRIRRWEHEGILDDMQKRLDSMPDASKIRRQTVEHPFGTLKAWMGSTHFLTKSMPKVSTEMSLHVLAYNLKRTLAMFGTKTLIGMIKPR